jgi:hypothetical protein
VVDETVPPQDRPSEEEAFAERVAPLLGLVERWRARIVAEAGSWTATTRAAWRPRSPRNCCGRAATWSRPRSG